VLAAGYRLDPSNVEAVRTLKDSNMGRRHRQKYKR